MSDARRSYESKQEFMTMVSHSLEVLEDGLVSETNRQSIRHGILETISNLLDLRDRANQAVMSVPILNAWGRDLGSAVEELASRYLLAIEEIDSLKSRLDRMQLAERAGVCKWQPDEGFDYTCINTGCGQSFVFEDGYEDGDHTYCSHCGRKIQYVPQPELEEGGEE